MTSFRYMASGIT